MLDAESPNMALGTETMRVRCDALGEKRGDALPYESQGVMHN